MVSDKQHIEDVFSAVRSGSAAARSWLAASWRRSLDQYGLDPAEKRPERRLGGRSLAERRALNQPLLEIAGPRLEALFRLVGRSGCGVLLTDPEGVVVERLCREGDAKSFARWRLEPGWEWSEAAEGTNGIGTCLAEGRQVTISRSEHFLACNGALTCMDAPIYGANGELIAALDVSTARDDQTASSNHLIGAIVGETARQIEADLFRASFPHARIVVVADQALGGNGLTAGLTAVDADDLVVGANRRARQAFGLAPSGEIAPRPASDLFGDKQGPTGFERGERAAIIGALAGARGNVSKAARMLGVGRATLYRRMKKLGIGGFAA